MVARRMTKFHFPRKFYTRVTWHGTFPDALKRRRIHLVKLRGSEVVRVCIGVLISIADLGTAIRAWEYPHCVFE